ncbi:MAG: hypothetical protein HYY06_10020 [Deltaproteobacteria bacterium]|nr:hypothetical protein [Deltaproteobacteria bacterium]
MRRLAAFLVAGISLAGCSRDDEAADADSDVDADADADGDEERCRELLSPEGASAGLEWCDTEQYGEMYRVEARGCSAEVAGEHVCDREDECDCGEGEACVWRYDGGCQCIRTCATDSECGDGFACLCAADDPLGWGAGADYSQCVEASCRSDTDCPGGRCALGVDGCFGPEGFACRGAADACATNDDCADLRCGRDFGAWSCGGWSECE